MSPYIIQRGGPRDPQAIPLATKLGTHITNERRRELAPDSLRASAELWASERPAARLRSISATYNCVGMVFASRRTWVDTDELEKILQEDGYHRVSGLDEIDTGDVLIYRGAKGEIGHIGVVLSSEPVVGTASWMVTVLSKWGAEGEYIHAPDHVPHFCGRPSEYWSERREMP